MKIRWLVPIADLFGRRGGVAAFLEARVVSSSSTRVRSQQGIKHQASDRTSHNELFSTFVIFNRFVQRNIFVPQATTFYTQLQKDQSSWKYGRVLRSGIRVRGRRYSNGTPATCLRWYFYVRIDSLSSSFFACWSLGSSLFSSIYAVLRRRASTFDAETLENEQPIHQMKSYSSPHLQRLHLPARTAIRSSINIPIHSSA